MTTQLGPPSPWAIRPDGHMVSDSASTILIKGRLLQKRYFFVISGCRILEYWSYAGVRSRKIYFFIKKWEQGLKISSPPSLLDLKRLSSIALLESSSANACMEHTVYLVLLHWNHSIWKMGAGPLKYQHGRRRHVSSLSASYVWNTAETVMHQQRWRWHICNSSRALPCWQKNQCSSL